MSAKVIDLTPKVARAPAAELPSEHDAAEEFTAAQHRTTLYDCDRHRWFRFDGVSWCEQPPGVIFSDLREIAYSMSGGHRKVCTHAFIAGAEAIARKAPSHEVRSDTWDADKMRLGTPGGTVDLYSGRLIPADPIDRITKLTSVAPEDGEPEVWLRFLEEATGGDAALIRFMQQVTGYALTGDTREHALFFIHGPGGNGKGVFLNTFTRILGGYAKTAAMDTFIASRNDRHSTELAELRGARLVTASETEEGRAWAESRIKQMTGGDPITARFMRQDNFTFLPEFKLVIIGNHEPVLRNVDDAMRRRFNVIPFRHKPARVDRTLEEQLKAEHGRILRWMIEGCVDWFRNGLVRPIVVEAETELYFEEQDLLGQFLTDACEQGPSFYEVTGRLFAAWEKYAHAAGEHPGKQKAFGAALRKRGFKPDREPTSERARIYWGLRLPQLDLPSAAGDTP